MNFRRFQPLNITHSAAPFVLIASPKQRNETMKRPLQMFCTAFVVHMLGACSTIVEGTDQTVFVDTDPQEAICNLSRDGNNVAIVNPTPGSVSLEKSSSDVIVHCKKNGYFEGIETLNSSFQDMTLGNAIFGGGIGLIVDASSGARYEYDKGVRVTLIPRSFDTKKARNEYFDRLKKNIENDASDKIRKIMKNCHSDNQDRCASDVKYVKHSRDKKLQDLAIRRENAVVE